MRILLLAAAAALIGGCVATKLVTVPVRATAKAVGTAARVIN